MSDIDKSGDRIGDNPSMQELRRNYRLAQVGAPLLRALHKLGFGNDRLIESLDRLLEEGEVFFSGTVLTLEAFNDHFATRGWIAYELMSTEVTKQAVELAKGGKYTEANSLLADYYDEKLIRGRLLRMRVIKEFRPRERLLLLALEDYAAERYHACIPVVLAQIDGFVNDIAQTGFFTDSTDLVVPDSIAAHSTGLAALSKTLSRGRRVTTEEQIDVPYRNGILHGRDLGYDNKIVAAKAWATLIALGDWVTALRKPPPPPPEPAPSFRELAAKLAENKKEISRLEEWEPRNILVGVDVPISGAADDYEEGSPERVLVEFIEYWQDKNYGKMGQLLAWPYQRESFNKTACWLRTQVHLIDITGFSLINVDDKNAFVTDIEVEWQGRHSQNPFSFTCEVRVLHEGQDQRWVAPGHPEGAWHLFPSGLLLELRRRDMVEQD